MLNILIVGRIIKNEHCVNLTVEISLGSGLQDDLNLNKFLLMARDVRLMN